MTIDFHTHNFPDHIAQRAVEAMTAKLDESIRPWGDGTLGRQMEDMARDGVDRAVMCPVATKPEQAEAIVRYAKEINGGKYGEAAAKAIVTFGSLHPADAELTKHIDMFLEAGMKGIKIHPYYQEFSLADPGMGGFFRSVRDAGLVVVSHCGQDPGYMDAPIECGPDEILEMFRNAPGIEERFVAAHLGGFFGAPAGAADKLLGTGCMIDTAVLEVGLEDPEAVRIIREWPAERMVFATDYYWTRQKSVKDWVCKHRESAADREKIFSANALKLLGE